MTRVARYGWAFALLLAATGLGAVALAQYIGAVPLALGRDLHWLASAVAAGCCVAAYCAGRGALRYGLVVLSLFAGGASALLVMQAVALRGFRQAGLADLVPLALILTQLWVAGVVHWRAGFLRGVGLLFAVIGPVRLVIVLALMAATAIAGLDRATGPAFALQACAALGLGSINLLSVLALCRLDAPFEGVPRLSPLLWAMVVLLASALFSTFAMERMPHSAAEVAYLFGARTFSEGALWAPAPPVPLLAGLDYDGLVLAQDRWFAATPPGWPAILALGDLAGLRWLVNPVLGGLIVLLAHSLATRLGGRDVAALAAALLATSPWLISLSASFMPNVLTIALTLLAWRLLVVEAKPWNAVMLALFAGLALGWAFAARPVEALVIGAVTGLWLLRPFPAGLGRVVTYSVGFLTAGAALFLQGWIAAGDPVALLDLPGELMDWAGQGDTASRLAGLLNAGHILAAVNAEAFGWSIGSLTLLWLALIAGRPAGYRAAMLAVLAVLGAATVVGGAIAWDAGLVPLALLGAGGLLWLSERAAAAKLGAGPVLGAAWVLCLFALLVFVPWRGVTQPDRGTGLHGDVAAAAASGTFGSALVFVRTGRDIGAAFALNDPFLREGRPIFLRHLDDETNAAAAAVMPDRDVVYFDADTGEIR